MAIKSIGIDIREAGAEGAGKSIYVEEITKALIKLSPNTKFSLFTKSANSIPEFQNSANIQQIIIKGKSIFWHFNLKKYLIAQPVDLFIAPSSYTYPAIAPKTQKIATVIHDLISFVYPQKHHWFPRLVEKLTLKKAIQNSSLIIAVSQNTLNDLHKVFPLYSSKSSVIVNPGIDKEIHFTPEKTLDLPEKFILSVATLNPRKNISGIIKAYTLLAEENPDLYLCIAGGSGWKTSQIYKSVPDNLKTRIKFLSYVPRQALAELYSRAIMLVYPSFYEGFGIPPIEAMACACPVIVSNVSSLPEVVANAGLLVDPSNIEDIKNAMQKLLNPDFNADLSQRALQRSNLFTWEKSARELLEVIGVE